MQYGGTIVGDLGGITLGPGIYEAAAAIAQTGTLTLDAENNPDAKWYFNVNAAFSTGAGSTIHLIDGGLPANVYWNVNGAVSTGAGSTLVGNIVAAGAVALGASTQVDGVIESSGGAVTLGAGSKVTGAIKAKGAVALGAGAAAIGGIDSSAAITLGANSTNYGTIVSDGSLFLGAGAQSGPVTSTIT
jgi:hypothetical protein